MASISVHQRESAAEKSAAACVLRRSLMLSKLGESASEVGENGFEVGEIKVEVGEIEVEVGESGSEVGEKRPQVVAYFPLSPMLSTPRRV